jgi:imidazolonepropionase
MKDELAVINCSQLVTLKGPSRPRVGQEMRELSIIIDGAMLVRDGRISVTGLRQAIEQSAGPDCQVIDAGGRIVLPGFVDAHTHPVFAGNRADEFEMRASGATYHEIAAAGGGIKSTVKRTRAATEDELFETGLRYTQWFLRTGTTTLEAKSGYGLSLTDELKMLRVIRRLNNETPLNYVPTFLGAHTLPDEYLGRGRNYVDLIVTEMLPQIAGERLAEYCDVFCDEGGFNITESRRVLIAAKKLGFGLRVHADQFSASGGAELAAELKAVTADHLEHSGQAQIERLKSAGVQPVLLPASVWMLGAHKYPEARAMIEAGLPVVIATDFNPGTSPVPSMLLVLSLASSQMKMTPAEALTAATINAAYSIGKEREIGSLETGKRADFVIHDCSDYRELAYFTGVEHPIMVYTEGQLWKPEERLRNKRN